MQTEQLRLMDETDLHYKVVQFIRRFFEEAIIVAGLGELQDTPDKRLGAWNKGYTKGQADILLLNRTRKHTGLAIELKTPAGTGVLSESQRIFLDKLKRNRYKTLVSCCYDEIIVAIVEHRDAARRCQRL